LTYREGLQGFQRKTFKNKRLNDKGKMLFFFIMVNLDEKDNIICELLMHFARMVKYQCSQIIKNNRGYNNIMSILVLFTGENVTKERCMNP
jgi:hypothetical protein